MEDQLFSSIASSTFSNIVCLDSGTEECSLAGALATSQKKDIYICNNHSFIYLDGVMSCVWLKLSPKTCAAHESWTSETWARVTPSIELETIHSLSPART